MPRRNSSTTTSRAFSSTDLENSLLSRSQCRKITLLIDYIVMNDEYHHCHDISFLIHHNIQTLIEDPDQFNAIFNFLMDHVRNYCEYDDNELNDLFYR